MDELDELEASVRAAARRRRVIVWSVVGVVALLGLTPCAIVTWNIGASVQDTAERRELASQRATAEQIAAVDEATRAAEASLSRRANAWRAAMSSAASLAPRPDLGPCPVRLPMRQPYSAERGGSFNNLDSFDAIVFAGGQAFPHVRTRDALPAEPPRVALAREEASRLRQRIRGEGTVEQLAEIVTAARALASSFWTYDVVVFTTRWEPPSVGLAGASFDSGHVSGLAVLYDYQSERPLCAGSFTAENTSQAVEYTAHVLDGERTLQSMLDAELDAEVERAVARELRHLAGPPLEPVAPDEGALP